MCSTCFNSASVHLKWNFSTGMPHLSTTFGSISQIRVGVRNHLAAAGEADVRAVILVNRFLERFAVAFDAIRQTRESCRCRAFRSRRRFRCDSRAGNRVFLSHSHQGM